MVSRGLYIYTHYKDFPIKGGMTIPQKTRLLTMAELVIARFLVAINSPTFAKPDFSGKNPEIRRFMNRVSIFPIHRKTRVQTTGGLRVRGQ